MKKIRSTFFFRYIFLAIVLSSAIALFYFHFFITDIVQKQLTVICLKNNCIFQGMVTKEGFLYPKIVIHNATVTSDNKDWHWQASSIECAFSLLRLVTYWRIPVSITCHEFIAFSQLNTENNLAIFDCLKIFSDTPKQFFKPNLQFLYAQNALIQVAPQQSDLQLTLQYHGRITAQENDTLESTATILDGTIKKIGNTDSFLSSISGIVHCVSSKQDNKISVQTKAFISDSQEPIYIKGTYENDSGRCAISTNYAHCFFDPIIYTRNNSKLSGQLSLAFLQKIFQKTEYLSGAIGINLTLDHTKNNALKGQVVLENCLLHTKRICSSAKIIISSKESTLFGPITMKTGYGDFSGHYSYDPFAHIGTCTIKNTHDGKTMLFPFVSLQNKSFDFQCNIYKQYCTMQATCDITDSLAHKTFKNTIAAMISDDGMQLRGDFGTMQLIGYLLWKKKYHGSLSIHDANKEIACITVQQENEQKSNFTGSIETNLIKTMTEFFIEPLPLYGNGTINFQGTNDTNIITANYSAQGGAIHIPLIHNFILNTRGTISIDTKEKKITIPELNAKFSTGSMTCDNAEISYNDAWFIEKCNIPIKIDKCAISLNNAFDSLISTKTTIYKETKNAPFFLSGTVRFHKGFIKNDEPLKQIFSEQRSFPFKSTMHIEHAIDFETEQPISVATKQIKTNIALKIISTGQITAPRLQGYITCHNGEILFPYKTLHITHGKVIFSDSNFQDASIELFARNVVKNYKISMRTTGSVAEHSIFFESSPALSQTQISSLLFFGSIQENISIFMPSLFSHTIKLGSLDIHFVPGFVDKSSRGGIRGALEIAVNNRLRATIQKNFTLSEDTRFELEYAITDNISLRAVRDERRDLGGEIELRWKF